MLGKFLGVIRNPQIRSLARKNVFHLYNEVPKFDPSKDYYQILEVTKDTGDSDIKKAYYRLAKSYHPDSNPGKEAKFKEINEAYSVLSDAKLKKQYNSARSFQGFSRKMGNKAKEGHYNYE
jgi:curved DNA-binding protein CbpA